MRYYFLVADTQLNKRLCSSVGLLVCLLVRHGDQIENCESTHFQGSVCALVHVHPMGWAKVLMEVGNDIVTIESGHRFLNGD